jgi:hypothetical protein
MKTANGASTTTRRRATRDAECMRECSKFEKMRGASFERFDAARDGARDE